VGAALSPRRVKNLVTVEPLREGLAGATKPTEAEVKGRILEYVWNLKKQGSPKGSIQTRISHLRSVLREGASLFNPESVKETIAQQEKWSEGYKAQIVFTYDSFIQLLGLTWIRPKYQQQPKLPFIPLEKELDDLIAGCGRKTGTMLLLLKETGMRIGEALRLEWIDLDTERHTMTLNHPEKRGTPRRFKLSSALMARLNKLPPRSRKIFGIKWKNAIGINFRRQRKRIADKLQNTRILRITFHTFRHWKATTEYHKTKDILHVKQLLGHKNINNTLVYIQLVTFESDEYLTRTAKTVKEAV